MGQIYYGDDALYPAISADNSWGIERPFVATCATMLGQTTATGFLIGDLIVLAPLPVGAVMSGFEVRVPGIDSAAVATFDLGDNTILAGAVSGTVGTAFTTPALGTSFTLTASASTAAFAATNGNIMINGHLFGYASLSGSTFVNVYSDQGGLYVPAGALIQQAANTAAYAQAVAITTGNGVTIFPWGSVSGTATATATAKPGGVPVRFGPVMNTVPKPNPAVPTQIGQHFLTLRLRSSPTAYVAPSVPITGSVRYYMAGVTL